MTLDLSLPTAWSRLSQQQLAFLLKIIALVNRANIGRSFLSENDFSANVTAQVATRCILHWCRLKISSPYGRHWILARDGKEYLVSSDDLAAAAQSLSWIAQIPDAPVRLDSIDGASAVAADLDDGFSFDDYLSCETLWQVWQDSRDDSVLRRMAAILYRKDSIRLREFEYLSIFYWWAAVKLFLSSRYPDFFKPAAAAEVPVIDQDFLRRSMDSQIRALTKGDVTKEECILALPVHRALTELDALAREFDELNRKYPTK